MAEQSRTPTNTRESYVFTSTAVSHFSLFVSNSKYADDYNRIFSHKGPLLGERRKDWLIKIRKDEGPHSSR